MGFFRADMADQALRCLELMDFKNKDQLMSSILQGQAAAMERQPVQPGSAAGAEVRPVSAMDQMRRQTQEAVGPGDLRGVRGEPDDPAGSCGLCAQRGGHRVRRGVGAGVCPDRGAGGKGTTAGAGDQAGLVTVAAEGDCRAEWQVIRCGLGQLAGKYPACVRLEA